MPAGVLLLEEDDGLTAYLVKPFEEGGGEHEQIELLAVELGAGNALARTIEQEDMNGLTDLEVEQHGIAIAHAEHFVDTYFIEAEGGAHFVGIFGSCRGGEAQVYEKDE